MSLSPGQIRAYLAVAEKTIQTVNHPDFIRKWNKTFRPRAYRRELEQKAAKAKAKAVDAILNAAYLYGWELEARSLSDEDHEAFISFLGRNSWARELSTRIEDAVQRGKRTAQSIGR